MSDKNVNGQDHLRTEDPITGLKRMFVDETMGGRIAQGQCPVQRPVFRKSHGCVAGTFKILPHLPQELRVGVFGYDEFPAWVRFSSDKVAPTGSDEQTPLGIAIKLLGVPGRKIIEGDEHATTQDFLLQNHDVFFVDNAQEMYNFTYEGMNGGYDSYLATHPKTDEIVRAMDKLETSVLDASYWSIVPFAFGPNQYVKYKLVPATPAPATNVDTTNPNYLHDELKQRLLTEEVALHFYIQLRTNEETMPLDQATVRWEESQSEPIHVATLTLHKQDIDARGQSDYGENLSFNTWRVLPEHTPVGSISEARKVAYKAAAQLRRYDNGVPIVEPDAPRSLENPQSSEDNESLQDNEIVDVVIHPAIGVARVGNSLDEYFFGPEVPGVHQMDPQGYRDRAGRIKRHAARFRLFGRNKEGKVVREITADMAEITWSVHVANVKSAWYEFENALDIPAAKGELPGIPKTKNKRRNAEHARKSLVIDPGKITITGKNTNPTGTEARYAFDKGTFFEKQVYLGELRTDENGHLIFLGGRGKSESVNNVAATTFANNEGWHDDTSDGPVDATVVINGQVFEAKGAWVLVGPPDYTPGVQAIVTGYDLAFEVATKLDSSLQPKRPTFSEHIYPILKRFSDYQWVNAGFAEDFGWGSPLDFTNPDMIAKLNDPSDSTLPLRTSIFNKFRHPNSSHLQADAWPAIYAVALANGGPLDGSYAGDITRWMAVPWQTDTSSCLSAYRPYGGEYLPTFWPARVPNDVLTEENYQTIMNLNSSTAKKVQAFSPNTREKWLRGIKYTSGNPAQSLNSLDAINKFVTDWGKVGILTKRHGLEYTSLFPQALWVETGRQLSANEESE